MDKTIKIDLFSDPVCPWCLLGLARLDNALRALPAEVRVEIAHHPFLLDANAPEGGEDVAEMLKRKYGREPFDTWDRLEAEAAREGVALDMRKQKWRYPSQGAQVLIAAAAGKGSQHKLARALGDAHYLEARNISDPEILIEIACRHGFAEDEARVIVTDPNFRRAIEEAAAGAPAQGISGVPFFIFQQKFALSGAQPREVFDRALQLSLENQEDVSIN